MVHRFKKKKKKKKKKNFLNLTLIKRLVMRRGTKINAFNAILTLKF